MSFRGNHQADCTILGSMHSGKESDTVPTLKELYSEHQRNKMVHKIHIMLWGIKKLNKRWVWWAHRSFKMLGKKKKLPEGDEIFWTLNKGQNIDSEVASSNDYKDQLNMAE